MNVGKMLILAGIVLVGAGVLWLLGARVGLGRLPGDIVIRGERSTFYFPLATCVVLSVVLSLLAWFVQRVGSVNRPGHEPSRSESGVARL